MRFMRQNIFGAKEACMKYSLTLNMSVNGYPHITTESDSFTYYLPIGEVILKSTMKLKLSSAARGIQWVWPLWIFNH